MAFNPFEAFEPSSDARRSATTMYEMYVSYLQVGFTEEQAMQLLTSMCAAGVAAHVQKQEGDS